MASTAIPTEGALLELEAGKIKDTPARKKEGGGYSAENITVLEGLEAVRLRPAMYIGSTGEMGLHHLVYEVVDNSVDEALAGHAKKIDVTIHVDNSITVVDDGRGIPVDEKIHANGEKMPAVAGGADQAACGRQIRRIELQSLRRSAWRRRLLRERAQRRPSTSRSGATATPTSRTTPRARPLAKLRQTGTSKKRGTKVHFLPDKSIFTVTEYNYDTLAQRLRELAFLNKGLEITLTDERTTDPKTGEAKRAEFKYAGGIAEFIKQLNKGKQVLHDKPIVMEATRDNVEIDIALQYNDAYSETVFTFANNINTVDGGTHLSGFKTALTRTINNAGQRWASSRT